MTKWLKSQTSDHKLKPNTTDVGSSPRDPPQMLRFPETAMQGQEFRCLLCHILPPISLIVKLQPKSF